jgi:hypothetical protein
MTWGEHLSATQSSEKTYCFLISVRAKIHNGIDGHDTFDDYWICCLYEDENRDPEDVEKGFLKSNLLVKVRIPPTMPPRLRDSADRLPSRLFR